jgi:hypothetical protein
MSTERVITDNELIATFMGALKKYDNQGGLPCILLSGGGVPVTGWYFNNNEIKYSSSWDWLMPVVKKINKLIDDQKMIGLDMNIYRSMRDWVTDVEIESAYGDAVTIIKWYNQQSPSSIEESKAPITPVRK